MTCTDEDLEKQYSPSQWSPHTKSEEVLRDYISETVRGSYIARSIIKVSFDVSYGKSDNQKVDIFGENSLPKDAPILVFLHGGYWISGSRKDSAFPARPLYQAGVLCIVLGYDLVSDTFTLPEVVTQVQCGLKFVLEYAQKRGSRGVYLCGHSAGAHLIAMALSSDPPESELYQLIKGVILISGIYDLNPLLKTSNAKSAHITDDIADFCSPLKAIQTLKNNVDLALSILVLVAEHDSPAFRKQSQDYSEALLNDGFENVEYLQMDCMDHFTIIQNLYDRDHFMTLKVIDYIKSRDQQCMDSSIKSGDEQLIDDPMKPGDQQSTDNGVKSGDEQLIDDPMKSGGKPSYTKRISSKGSDSRKSYEFMKSVDEQSMDDPMKSNDQQSTDSSVKSGDEQPTDDPMKSVDQLPTDISIKPGEEESVIEKPDYQLQMDDSSKSDDQASVDYQPSDYSLKSGNLGSSGVAAESQDHLTSSDESLKSKDQESTNESLKSVDSQLSANSEDGSTCKINNENISC